MHAEYIRCLDSAWDEALAIFGVGRARVWRLYIRASALGFEGGGISLHQLLGVVRDSDGGSGLPPTRRDWN
jgi:cyclopropane-fatty-acyl-phospholipid synthase